MNYKATRLDDQDLVDLGVNISVEEEKVFADILHREEAYQRTAALGIREIFPEFLQYADETEKVPCRRMMNNALKKLRQTKPKWLRFINTGGRYIYWIGKRKVRSDRGKKEEPKQEPKPESIFYQSTTKRAEQVEKSKRMQLNMQALTNPTDLNMPSPMLLSVLVHYYALDGDYWNSHLCGILKKVEPLAPAMMEILGYCESQELLIRNNEGEAPTAYTITARGRSYVEGLLRVPFPKRVTMQTTWWAMDDEDTDDRDLT